MNKQFIQIADHTYKYIETVQYTDHVFSDIFSDGCDAIIIDYDLCSDTELFSYQEYTNKQNEYVYRYRHVYRFYATESLTDEVIEKYILNYEIGDDQYSYRDRDHVMDNTPVEHSFEDSFMTLFGSENLGKLHKEYPINDDKGNSYVLDYYLESETEKVAVEENGVNYHHPQLIKEERYIHQLDKQNTCTKNDIKLYRFSSQDLCFKDKMLSDMETYLSSIVFNGKENILKGEREFRLYDHQIDNLNEISKRREEGLKTCLVVLPTASGKSKIIEEDLKRFDRSLHVLVIAPTTMIVEDWKRRLKVGYEHDFTICTYAFIQSRFNQYDSKYFDYIVVDEAHHAVAPMLKRVLQYFDPMFMIGLTATDQRLDHKKLEEVFGQYETKLDLKEAMELGIVSKARVFRIESNIDLSEVRFNGKDYVNADLEKSIRVESRNELIAKVLHDYFSQGSFSKKQGIIFCVNVKHAKEMSRILNDYGIPSEAFVSGEKNLDKVMESFRNKKIRFLCACEKISEGWDYDDIEIIVMARPTMSKVVYLQQIGRGLRKGKNKECVHIIDVVDEYGSMVTPWSMHAIFKMNTYVPFGDITRQYQVGDMICVEGLSERVKAVKEVDILTFEEKYQGYLSAQQLAIECFVNDNTIINWIKKNEITPDLSMNFGSRKIYLFSPENVTEIKRIKNIGVHDASTIKDDFYDFLSKKDYTFSFKMVFMLSLLKHLNMNGLASIDDVLEDYIAFYQDRIDQNLPIDKAHCVLNQEKLNDYKYMKKSLLDNPFEKYERKRFIFYSKDLSQLAIAGSLFQSFTKEEIEDLKKTYRQHLEEYYENYGGLQKIDDLL